MRIGKFAFGLAFSANVLFSAAYAAVYRVSPDATVSSFGASWSEATTLSDALSKAKSGDEVWLKSGVYSFPASVDAGAVIATDAKIRGGFAGSESSAKERKFAEPTVLKGAVTALKVTAISGLVEIDNITVKGAKGHGIFKEGFSDLLFHIAIFYALIGKFNSVILIVFYHFFLSLSSLWDQISRFSTYLAFCSINSRRGST
jgi:hypothetical protein